MQRGGWDSAVAVAGTVRLARRVVRRIDKEADVFAACDSGPEFADAIPGSAKNDVRLLQTLRTQPRRLTAWEWGR